MGAVLMCLRSNLPATAPATLLRYLCNVWDRRRFEHLWGWAYRFEAYTPPAKRIRGYYAMPMLWHDRVIGWANASVEDGQLKIELGYQGKRPAAADFRRELEAEIERLKDFLG